MSWDMLLHPELMSNEQLIGIIQQRHLRVPNIHIMRRDELLNVFHQYCVPYGQRKYKDTGRGKVLNKNRNTSPERPDNLHTTTKNAKTNDNKYTNPKERLKPPPDLLSGHVKRIKLDTKQVTNDSEKFKRKTPVDSDTLATECPPVKKERKPITWP